MKKIFLLVLFLTFFTGTGYSAKTLLNYKYNKQEQRTTPIEFVKVTKSNDEYKISYKLKCKIICEQSESVKKYMSIQFPYKPNQSYSWHYDRYGDFVYEDSYNFGNEYDSKKIIFTFTFDYYDSIKNIDSKKFLLRNTDKITVSNPVKISYQYNEHKNSFEVIQTILCIDEKGELTEKDIEVTDIASDEITFKEETLFTNYYVRLREEKERISEEERKREIEEQRKREKEEMIAKEKRLSTIVQKMKNYQDVSKYPVEDIIKVFKEKFDGILTDVYSGAATLNVEKGKNVWLPTLLVQIFPKEGFMCIIGNLNSYHKAIYVQYKYTEGFVTGQVLDVFAKIIGTYSYYTLYGDENTIPKLKAYFVRKRSQY